MTLRRRLAKLEAKRGAGFDGPLYLFTEFVRRDDAGALCEELHSALAIRRPGGESVQLFREAGETEVDFEARVTGTFDGAKPALRLGPQARSL
jgi:hypothetical protein